MLLEALLALTTVLPRLDDGLDAARAQLTAIGRPPVALQVQAPPLPYFGAVARAVSNWREEAGASLMPTSLALVAKYSGTDPAFVARCVKLNNYWCIKQARWAGELGGDAEGHTGFATAADGADAAAQLLRRYYRDYSRRTALAIVRRWAPAECGIARPVAASPRVDGAPKRAAAPAPKVSAALAPRGIGNTLRARFLAGHARGGAPRRVAVARTGDAALRVQPWSARARLAGHAGRASRAAAPLPALKPVADIATGIGAPTATVMAAAPKLPSRGAEGPRMPPIGSAALLRPREPVLGEAGSRKAPAVRAAQAATARATSGAADPAALLSTDRLVAESAALPSIVAGLPGGRLLDLSVPAPFCSNDETRIRNYAERIAGSVGLKPEDDLKLFEADGMPSARLAPVMLAMSSVELGALRASPALVAAAIGRLALRVQAATASAAN